MVCEERLDVGDAVKAVRDMTSRRTDPSLTWARIDGGFGPTTLDFSRLTTAPVVALTSEGSIRGLRGYLGSISPRYDNITSLIGSESAGGSLQGGQATRTTTWVFGANGTNTYSTSDSGSVTLSIVGFDRLYSTAPGSNTYNFADGAKASDTTKKARRESLGFGYRRWDLNPHGCYPTGF